MKFLRLFFFAIFTVQMFGLVALWQMPLVARAADAMPLKMTPQVGIPGTAGSGEIDFSGKSPINFADYNSTAPLAQYIKWIYKYLIGIAGILATFMLMFGGFRWIMGAADSGAINEAKDIISTSLIGLVLVMTSYLILSTVNNDLVNFKPTKISSVEAMGCCVGEPTCSTKSSSQCKDSKTFLKNGSCIDNKCQIIDTSKINGCEKIFSSTQCKSDPNCVWLGTDCVASSATKSKCEYYNANTTCSLVAGCVWNSSTNTCAQDTTSTSLLKCDITQAEYSASATGVTCCKGPGATDFKYARLTINKYCSDACGASWSNWGNSAPNCRSQLGWGP